MCITVIWLMFFFEFFECFALYKPAALPLFRALGLSLARASGLGLGRGGEDAADFREAPRGVYAK